MAIKTILLAVGPDDTDQLEQLFEETVDVAGPTGATVVLAHVFTRSGYAEAIDNLEYDVEDDDVTPDDVAKRYGAVRQLVRRFDAADVDYEVRGAIGDRGDRGDRLVELATAVGADRIVVGGRRRSPAGKAIFGSTAQEIMLSAPCPVTFVREA